VVAETIQLVGVLAFAAVLLFLIVHGLVTWWRSRGRPSKKDDGGDGDVTGTESGYWGEANSGIGDGGGTS
jgi:hypothetical protein